MISIFGKPLEDVSYQDVVDFASLQPKEGLNLDYKQDLSNISGVVKTLVSMANTNGGWVIIGIEDENDKPKLPAVGMPYAENYEQKISNSIIASVNPIVLPQYRTVHSEDKKHTFVVAYMQMSSNTPHWMSYKSKNVLFTRVADRASSQEWEEYASSHQWEMLQAKRVQSIELRKDFEIQMNTISNEASKYAELASDDPFNIIADDVGNPLRPAISSNQRDPSGNFIVRIIPEFPSEALFKISDLVSRLNDTSEWLNVHSGYAPYSTPRVLGDAAKTHQHTAYICYKAERARSPYFFGIDTFGQIFNISPVQQFARQTKRPFVPLPSLMVTLEGAMRYAGKLYTDSNTDTLLRIECELDVRANSMLYHEGLAGMNWPWSEDNPPENLTGGFYLVQSHNASDLVQKAKRKEIMSFTMKQMLYAFNYTYHDDEIFTKAIDVIVHD